MYFTYRYLRGKENKKKRFLSINETTNHSFLLKCHCSSRYKGKNCEIDTGPPCRSNPCLNNGVCIEDNRGDYTCNCEKTGYFGSHCEIEISVHPLCENKPCLNDGICKVVSGSSKIECDCAKGFSGSRCEVCYLLNIIFFQNETN